MLVLRIHHWTLNLFILKVFIFECHLNARPMSKKKTHKYIHRIYYRGYCHGDINLKSLLNIPFSRFIHLICCHHEIIIQIYMIFGGTHMMFKSLVSVSSNGLYNNMIQKLKKTLPNSRPFLLCETNNFS